MSSKAGVEPSTNAPLAVSMASRDRSLADRLGELWEYRHLILSLVSRDLKVRYKGSVLGFFWSLVNPLLMMLVLSVVFGILFPSGDYPNFHVFVLVAIMPWNWFNASVAGGLTSIVGNAPLINKVYFPREVLPISMVVSELVNLLFALPVLLGIVLYAGIPVTRYALWLPVIVLIQFAFTLGFVFILATANVYYRDTGLIMDVVLLAWFFLSPIFYPAAFYDNHSFEIMGTSLAGSRVAFIVNPIASLISSYRVVLYGSIEGGPPGPPDLLFLGRTALTAVVMLAIGYAWFLRHSGRFGEEV